MDFKVGDRVRIKMGLRPGYEDSPVWVSPLMCEMSGKTLTIDECCSSGVYRMKECYFGWHESILEPINPPVCIPKPTWRIIIEGDENTSRAKYIMEKRVIQVTTAKRYHKDKHDPAMAARALIGKMFPEAKEPEKPKYFTGRVVCVECPEGSALTVGKIYEVKNGEMDCDEKYAGISMVTSVENLNSRCKDGVKFIEIKE